MRNSVFISLIFLISCFCATCFTSKVVSCEIQGNHNPPSDEELDLETRRLLCRKLRLLKKYDATALQLYGRMCRCKCKDSSKSSSTTTLSTTTLSTTTINTDNFICDECQQVHCSGGSKDLSRCQWCIDYLRCDVTFEYDTTTPIPITSPPDIIEEECYWCGEICEWSWQQYLHVRESNPDFCPNCIAKCAAYGHTIVDNYTPTPSPSPSPPTHGDPLCIFCGECPYRRVEDVDPNESDLCSRCVLECGWTETTFEDTTPTVPITSPPDMIEEECYWCGEICEWSWQSYLYVRESNPDFCINCIAKCAEHGRIIVDNYFPTTTSMTETTTS